MSLLRSATFISLILSLGTAFAALKEAVLIEQETAKRFDSFIDPEFDYAAFYGRVTDKDESGTVFKVQTEDKNIRFFKAGDRLTFLVDGSSKKEQCEASLRSTEEGYFIIYVKSVYPCWGSEDIFRRGTKLQFESPVLAKRVQDASLYRATLVRQKQDFLKQLSHINNFVWSYEQERVNVAAKYDQEIAAIEKSKQRELELLLSKKKDQVVLQRELQERLNTLDTDLDFYRVDKVELLVDRWGTDQHIGLPVEERPSELKSNE